MEATASAAAGGSEAADIPACVRLAYLALHWNPHTDTSWQRQDMTDLDIIRAVGTTTMQRLITLETRLNS